MRADLWWQYTGYAWLANQVPPRRAYQKLLLVAGMAGFLIAAIGIPQARDRTGVVFGIGYLLACVVHLVRFSRSAAHYGVLRLAPTNLAAALIVLAAGFTAGPVVYGLWAAAFLLQAVVPFLVPRYSWAGAVASFRLATPHFVERHGLLVIVALDKADPDRRSWLAARAYNLAHIPLLLGIVGTAVGIRAAVAHPDRPADLGPGPRWPVASHCSSPGSRCSAGCWPSARGSPGSGRRPYCWRPFRSARWCSPGYTCWRCSRSCRRCC